MHLLTLAALDFFRCSFLSHLFYYLLLNADRMSIFCDPPASATQQNTVHHLRADYDEHTLFLRPAMSPTFHFQVKGAAVELVLVGHLASVVPRVVFFGFDDVHFKGVDLSEWHMCYKCSRGTYECGSVWCRTFVCRSKVSFSCRCFPVLLARSIHLPLNHLIVGLRRRSLASTLAMKVMSPPLIQVESTGRGLRLGTMHPTFAQSKKLTVLKLNFDDVQGVIIILSQFFFLILFIFFAVLCAVTHPQSQWHSGVSRSAGWTAAGCRWACPAPRAAGPLPGTTLLSQGKTHT